MNSTPPTDSLEQGSVKFELSHVSKFFGATCVLNDFTASFQESRIYALLGLSGSGKSTILRLMMRLLEPSGGQLLFRGQSLQSMDVLQLRRAIGYVLQGGGLFPHLSSRDNIAIVARYLKWPPAKIRDRIDELAELMSIPHELLDRFPHALSGGQAQRMSLMRALMLDPDVLLLDEPFGALDPITRHDLQQELRPLFTRLGKLVIVVTHDLNEASILSDEAILLHQGTVVQRGTLEAFRTSPATEFVERFVEAQQAIPGGG